MMMMMIDTLTFVAREKRGDFAHVSILFFQNNNVILSGLPVL